VIAGEIMAVYHEATFRPVVRFQPGRPGSIAKKLAAPRRLILHTAVSGKTSLFDSFNVAGTPTAHFYVAHNGAVEQYIDTAFRSTANLDGNHDCITVESQDVGRPFPAWDTKGSDVPAWTPAQLEALADLAVWAHLTHGVPLTLLPSAKPRTRGVGWHRQGIDPTRVADGELWSKARGKVCPGDRRIAQIPGIVSRAAEIMAQQTSDVEPASDSSGGSVPTRPADDRWKVGVRDAAFSEMGQRFLQWLPNDEIARSGSSYRPGPVYSEFDDFNVRKVQALMGNAPDPAGKAYLGPLQWGRLFAEDRPARAKLPRELAGTAPPQLRRKEATPSKPKPTPAARVPKLPGKELFVPGAKNPAFTPMGERFLIWLTATEIHKAGRVYTPGPRYSIFDARNVRAVQALMGNKPDPVDAAFFGAKQWERLFRETRPKGAKLPPALRPGRSAANTSTPESTPVTGQRITVKYGKPGSWAAGEHTGVDLGSDGDDTIRCVGTGTVFRADEVAGWGKRVVVKHPNGRFSWYCHLSSIKVKPGQKVSRGAALGVMGATGRAFGKHLHYQESTGGIGYYAYKRPIMLGFSGY
jgi:murein DD-endopeptidase MepM/ murein hydrolase activator NlpD